MPVLSTLNLLPGTKQLICLERIRLGGKNSGQYLIHINNILNRHKISSINAFLMEKVKTKFQSFKMFLFFTEKY
jgi:hypothetical protein